MTKSAPAIVESPAERKRRLARERQQRRRQRPAGTIVVELVIPPDVADDLPDLDEGDRAAALLALIRRGQRMRHA